jgi:PAS domain S-box-containing protein
MNQDQIDILKRALKREKSARKSAEKILEEKSRDLYFTSQKLEQHLDEKSSQLQGIFENIVDAYIVLDINNGNVLKFNEEAKKLFGYNAEKDIVNAVDLIYEKDIEYAKSFFFKLQTKGYFKNYEARIYTKSKEVRWVHINASIVLDKYKNPIAAQGIVRDITDQKNSEKKLIESQNRLSALIKNLETGVLVEDENRNVILSNEKFCELFSINISIEELIGKNFTNITERKKKFFKNPIQVVKRVKEILKNKKMVVGDQLFLTNGKIIECDYIPITIDNLSAGYMSTYKDVTNKVNHRRNLEKQKEKYFNIIANMQLGLMEVDKNDRILMVNQSFLDMSGFSEKELIGKIAKKIFQLKVDAKKIKERQILRLKGESDSYELNIINKKGEIKHWLVSGGPNYNDKGVMTGSIGIHLDITELKMLELQKEKLLFKLEKSNEELQEYAHIVSHDLKSPLRSIDALVNWIKEDNKNNLDDDSRRNLDLIEITLEKMEKLISDILNYSSVSSLVTEKKDVNLNQIVNDLITLMYIPDNVKINIKNSLPFVKGDKTKLQQVFQNLIGNAIKFSNKKRGFVEIDFKTINDYYEFSIKDTGIGIEKKYHSKIFKIFHTLDKSKYSTGIGLSIVKKIVNLHEGEIWLESQPNKGSTFFFTIKK